MEADIRRALAFRILLCLPFLAGSALLLSRLSFLAIFLGAGMLMVPAYLLAPVISELVAHRAGSLYHPEEKREAPRLMFSLPEACIMQGRYGEAMQHLLAMRRADPGRVQVSIRIIDLALRHLDDPAAAEEAYHDGMTTADTPERRSWLAEEYGRLMALYRAGELR